ncbi:MAG: type 2 isopentenyl-diphosphate Delta-isomerase [Nitrososphaeraceae archaeon]|jgi:isopentenyl-diphosphate Delta-isomerase
MTDPVRLEEEARDIMKRKQEGIDIPLNRNVQAKTTSTFLEYVKLVHDAIPELNLSDIDTTSIFLGRRFSAPLIIDSMTGGTAKALLINGRLAELAESYSLPMGVGSQRAGLVSEKLADSYTIARKKAPNAFLIANIGGAQLSSGLSIDKVKKLIEMINADALVVHLNPLQELVQPEGEPRYSGVLKCISDLVKVIGVPVMAKEVGAGISREAALKLNEVGVSAINVAGAGGTSWAGVEKVRAESASERLKTQLGELFWDWGIPTALSIIVVRRALMKLPLIASGGIRNGLEIAKCIAIGADMCAMAYPFLVNAVQSKERLYQFADTVIAELKSTMFLVGAGDMKTLKSTKYILTGELRSEANEY